MSNDESQSRWDPAGLEARLTKPTNVRWLIFALACGTSFLTYIHRYSWSVARPFVKEDYGISDVELGWLDAAFNLTYALAQFPGGLLGDFFGPRIVITLCMVVWSLAMVGPTLAGKFWGLLGVRLGFGLSQAACYPNLGKITKSWFPLKIRTSVQGMVASFSGRAGGAMAPFLIGTILMAWVGLSWQNSLYVLAGSGFLYAIGFWFVFRNQPGEHHWSNEQERLLVEAGESQATSGRPKFIWSRAALTNLAIFMSASFCSAFADNLFVFYMPQFLLEEKGFTTAQMGLFAGLPIWGGALGGMCGGVLNDVLIRKLGNRRLARSLVASGGKTIAAVLIAASLLVQDGRTVMAVLFFCKFFSDWSQPTWWGTVTDIGGPAAGRVFGMVNMVSSLGATLAGPLMGIVLFRYGWSPLFLFVGGVYLLTALFWGFVNCTRKLVE